MNTSFGENLRSVDIRTKIGQFYDMGSPLYFEVYGEHIHDGYYLTGKESKQEAQENLIRLVAEKARIHKKARVLDVGCGLGGGSFWLADHLKATTVGITISSAQLDIARNLAKERNADSTFLLMNAEDMHFDETFDVIWTVASSTHFQDPQNYIRSASSFLKPGGKFIIFDWMSHEDIIDVKNDPHLRPVNEGMLLASLNSINSYISWFVHSGYRITYAEDITDHTLKTWDDALSVIKDPSILKYASRITKAEVAQALHFFKSIRSMKRAMKMGKMKAAIIIAEKL